MTTTLPPFIAPALPSAVRSVIRIATIALLPLAVRVISSIHLRATNIAPSRASAMPAEGTRWFEPGQTGVTYQALLGEHLAGAASITIVDPHVKTFRQIRNFSELLDVIADPSDQPIDVRLITSRASGGFDWEFGQANALVELKGSAQAKGVRLTVEFDDTNHDRWITTKRWTILLGKGLDVWTAKSCATLPQDQRPVGQRFAVV